LGDLGRCGGSNPPVFIPSFQGEEVIYGPKVLMRLLPPHMKNKESAGSLKRRKILLGAEEPAEVTASITPHAYKFPTNQNLSSFSLPRES